MHVFKLCDSQNYHLPYFVLEICRAKYHYICGYQKVITSRLAPLICIIAECRMPQDFQYHWWNCKFSPLSNKHFHLLSWFALKIYQEDFNVCGYWEIITSRDAEESSSSPKFWGYSLYIAKRKFNINLFLRKPGRFPNSYMFLIFPVF